MTNLNKILLFIITFSFITLTFAAQNNSLAKKDLATSSLLPPAAKNTPLPPNASVPPAPVVNANGYILMDANSGQILAGKNIDAKMEPASLTKVVSLYVIAEALKSGRIHLTDQVPISRNAWKTGGSRMFVQVNTQVPAQDLIDGIAIVSGNDAAVAMAEYVGGGSTDNFINLMNQSAAQLGMKNSHFADVNGLPISNHYTSPRDLAILARAMVENYPDYYKSWFSQKWFEYNKIKQANRNRLLWRDPSVDGMKTGHTDAAGYCLIASAERNDMRLISVIMGAPSSGSRIDSTQALLNWGFRNYSTHQLFPANQPLAQERVWFGDNKETPLGLIQGLFVTIPNNQYQNLKAFLILDQKDLHAPINKGQTFGKVEVTLNNQPLLSEPVVALQNNPRGGVFDRVRDHVIMLFRTT